MCNFIFSNSEIYAVIADESYLEYNKYNTDLQKSDTYLQGLFSYEDLILVLQREKAAFKAIVFQALAIEAYVNLFGYYQTGKREIKGSNGKYLSTAEKLERLCQGLQKQYPNDDLKEIKALFYKRDSLVHQKPQAIEIEKQPFDLGHLKNNYDDIAQFYNSWSSLFENIEFEMTLYKRLKANIKSIRGSKLELLEEIQQSQVNNAFNEIADNIEEMIQKSLN